MVAVILDQECGDYESDRVSKVLQPEVKSPKKKIAKGKNSKPKGKCPRLPIPERLARNKLDHRNYCIPKSLSLECNVTLAPFNCTRVSHPPVLHFLILQVCHLNKHTIQNFFHNLGILLLQNQVVSHVICFTLWLPCSIPLSIISISLWSVTSSTTLQSSTTFILWSTKVTSIWSDTFH